MSTELLQIKDLKISNPVNGLSILNGISFSAEKGKITGIVGESGSGKSITALSLLRLLPYPLIVESGEAIFQMDEGKKDLCKIPPDRFNRIRGRQISMIFQEPMTSLNPSMRCGKQIAESMRFHFKYDEKESRSQILNLFNQTGLPQPERIYRSYPHQLSGGQRQRVMIAMALSTKPSLLIADEPTTALDVSVQKSIIQLMQKLQEELSLSIIFISHDLKLMGDIADRIVVMRNGNIVETGSRDNIFFSPAEAYTRGLLECQPPLDKKPERLLTVSDFEKGLQIQPVEPVKPVNTQTVTNPDITDTTSEKEPLLVIKDLVVNYSAGRGIFGRKSEGLNAVDKVSLSIYRGETLGLVGESGCGKTTLGKTILMLMRNYSGSIIYKGIAFDEMDHHEQKRFRKQVQVVFQDPYSSLNPRMRVGTVLAEARKLHFPGESSPERTGKLEDLISRTGLDIFDLKKYPHEFSGGQRQRIGITRALVTEPELLVLDESVSALDVSVQSQILNLLNDLKDDFKLSYIFISHDLAVVKYMSDRIIVMKDGKFEEQGPAGEIYRNPVSEYTKKLINAVPGYQNSSGSS